MKKHILLLIFLSIVFSLQVVGQAATIGLGDHNAAPGHPLNIPVSVTGFDEVEAITIYFSYDPNVLTFSSFVPHVDFGGMLVHAGEQPNGSFRIGISWAPGTKASLLDDDLVVLTFQYQGGSSDLVFDGANCEVVKTVDGEDYIVPLILASGSVSPVGEAAVEIGDVLNQNPGPIEVPLNVDFSGVSEGVGSFTFYITYDESKLEFISLSDAALSGMLINTLTSPTTLIIDWINPDVEAETGSLYAGLLAKMRFNYLGGNTRMDFDESISSVASHEAIEVGVLYKGGEITQDPASLISVSLPDILKVPGSAVSIPLTVSNFKNVSSFDLRIAFDPLTMTFLGLGNLSPLSIDQFRVNVAGGELGISWIGGPLDATGDLFDIVFDYHGGASQLVFNTENCAVSDDGLNELAVEYYNGSISEDVAYDATAAIPNLLGTNGQFIDVPVYVTGFDNLGAINLAIEYNNSILTFSEITNVYPGLINNGTYGTNVSGTRFFFDWVVDPTINFGEGPAIPDNEPLFLMRFTFNGGTSALGFDMSECAISRNDENITLMAVTYSDGSVYGGIVSLAESTITADPSEITAGESSTITVQLKDQLGNLLPASGGTVQLLTDIGMLSAVTDNDDGTYSAVFTSTESGTATITGTLNEEAFADNAQVNISTIFNIKVFLEGLFDLSKTEMNKTNDLVNNEIVSKFAGNISDLISIELHSAGSYGTPVYSVTGVELLKDGSASVLIPGEYSGTYYVTVKHRNHLETVSAVEVSLSGTSAEYDFTISSSQAYGNNQKQLATGVYGVFAGDVDQNGAININDVGPINTGLRQGASGYLPIDINGDGVVNINDAGPVNTSIRLGVGRKIPN